jgi:glyoxalase family protein
MRPVHGLHHVTAISGPAQENLDFYTGILGMRLVKKSVNQDDPGTYHLFYADDSGHPGTDLTFFPWAHMAPPRIGHGLAVEVSLQVPQGTLAYWSDRLTKYGVAQEAAETRFGERALPLVDPHGMRVALVESSPAPGREFSPSSGSPVEPERQIRGLHTARLWESNLEATTEFLTGVLGFTLQGDENGWQRYTIDGGGSGRVLDVRAQPDARRGSWGVGAIHHLAWRVEDDEHQAEVRAAVEGAHRHPTPVIDRFWFRSVYFKEPGGVLFELATDGPGFAVDEQPEHLGEALVLPPWLEPHRGEIQAVLPALSAPQV